MKKTFADIWLHKEYRGGDISVIDSKLTSLEGSPTFVTGNFFCSRNKLVTLEGGPEEVTGGFWCRLNDLRTLKGAPRKVSDFYCTHNSQLQSLDGAPQEVDGDFDCNQCPSLLSLSNIHTHIKRITGEFDADDCPIKSNVLGLLLIKDLKHVYMDANGVVAAIINSHLDGGSMRSAMECQAELIQAGFEEYAKL